MGLDKMYIVPEFVGQYSISLMGMKGYSSPDYASAVHTHFFKCSCQCISSFRDLVLRIAFICSITLCAVDFILHLSNLLPFSVFQS
jgi:hypothetical protein